MVNGKSVCKGQPMLVEKQSQNQNQEERGRIYVVSYTKASGVKIDAINMKNKRKSTNNKRQQGTNDDDVKQQQQP